MQKLYFMLQLLALFVITGCAVKTGHQFLEKMSNEDISSKLVKGQTSKNQVKELFGDPSDVDVLPDGKENWVYSYVRSSSKGINFVPYANLVYSGTNDNTRKLKILFDTEGKVEFFAFANSKGETKAGLFQ